MTKQLRTKYSIGDIRMSNGYGEYKIISKQGAKYTIEFLLTKYKTSVRSIRMHSGEIKDPYFPKVVGIGFIGIGNNKPTNKGIKNKLYTAWSAMLYRTYNSEYHKLCPSYKNVTVDKRWHNFQNFCEDLKQLDGYEQWLSSSSIHLDKDLLQLNTINKIYSKNTVCFISNSQNTILSNNSKSTYKGISPLGEEFLFTNQREFANAHKLKRNGISSVICKKQITHKGWKFYKL